jgi:general secretion pathway protein A
MNGAPHGDIRPRCPMTGTDMLTYFALALGVALLAGLTGGMPSPMMQAIRPGSPDDEGDTDIAEKTLAENAERNLPPEILDALAEVERLTDRGDAAVEPVPLSKPADPGRVVMVSGRRRLLDDIADSLMQGTQFVCLTGAAGVGKTTMAVMLHDELSERSVRVHWVDGGGGSGIHLRTIMSRFLSKPEADVGTEDVERLFDAMTAREAPDERLVLIIDDAQQLLPDALSYLRLLASVAIERMPQIVFVGEPSFWDIADHAGFRDLIPTRFELTPLSAQETGTIAGRLMSASNRARRPVLEADALEVLAERSNGLPGRVVALAAAIEVVARERNEIHVTADTVDAAAARLAGGSVHAVPAAERETVLALVPTLPAPRRKLRTAQMAGVMAVAAGAFVAVACWLAPQCLERVWAEGPTALQSRGLATNVPADTVLAARAPADSRAPQTEPGNASPDDAAGQRSISSVAQTDVIKPPVPTMAQHPQHGMTTAAQWPAPPVAPARRPATLGSYVTRSNKGTWLFAPLSGGG